MYSKHLRDYGNAAGKILTEAYSELRELSIVNCFCKKLHLRYLKVFRIRF